MIAKPIAESLEAAFPKPVMTLSEDFLARPHLGCVEPKHAGRGLYLVIRVEMNFIARVNERS